MYSEEKILIGYSGEEPVYIYPQMANRHGMIAGATGTGKTTTVKTVAESFSDAGVPVFIADVKGDLSGIAEAGQTDYACSHPANFWDVYGEKGMPLRTTISEMGPLLLSRILGLNDTQEDLLTVAFKIADDEGLLLIDTKDLKAALSYIGENASAYSLEYGNIAKNSLTTIIRAVVALESEGGELFFGEPALDIKDWFATDPSGKGMIQVFDCQKLIHNPTMYSTFLLWMLSELYETLPEVGDLPKPRMVFFFDEAHMLFNNASKSLLDKVEQVVKLIRSKGVGIFFITQSPKDIPNGVLAQLGNKIQHALHAYTPAEQKNVKAAAESYRVNEEFDTFTVLQELQIGEALVSVLDEKGIPTVVERTKIMLPESNMKPVSDASRDAMIKGSSLYIKYFETVDRDSAYEFLQRQTKLEEEEAEENAPAKKEYSSEAEARKAAQREYANAHKVSDSTGKSSKTSSSGRNAKTYKPKQSASTGEKIAKSVARSAAGTVGREVGNTLGKSIGGSFGKKIGGNVGSTLARGIMGSFFR